MTALLIKIIAGVALLGGLIAFWHHDRETYAKGKVDELAAKVEAEAKRDKAEKLAVELERTKAMAAATEEAQANVAQLKGQLDEKDRVIAAGRTELVRVRATAVVARRSEVRSDPGSACHAQELRSERLAATVEDLQRSDIEVTESNIELRGFLSECDAGAATDAVMLQWWFKAERAMRLGEEP